MMNLTMLLAESEQTGGLAASWPLLLVLGLFLVLMIWNMFSGKKRQNESEKMLNELKVGDKVVTNAGIYGEIVSIRHTNFGKVALIKSGEDDKVSYISVNLSVILGIDEKHDVIVDADGNVIDPEEDKETEKETKDKVEKAKNLDENSEEKTEDKSPAKEELKTEEVKEEKPAKIPAKKQTKSTTKKTTAKKTETKKAE